MKELSLHILDIANNSVRGNATEISIDVKELVKKDQFIIDINDNGEGIPAEIFESIKNPFTTSRTMRKVGLGIPLLNDTCLLCNGYLDIKTQMGEGTKVEAKMDYHHIDRPPLGDIVSTIVTLMTSNQNINLHYRHFYNDNRFEISTSEIVEVLGDVPLSEIAVVQWLKEYLRENINELINEN